MKTTIVLLVLCLGAAVSGAQQLVTVEPGEVRQAQIALDLARSQAAEARRNLEQPLLRIAPRLAHDRISQADAADNAVSDAEVAFWKAMLRNLPLPESWASSPSAPGDTQTATLAELDREIADLQRQGDALMASREPDASKRRVELLTRKEEAAKVRAAFAEHKRRYDDWAAQDGFRQAIADAARTADKRLRDDMEFMARSAELGKPVKAAYYQALHDTVDAAAEKAAEKKPPSMPERLPKPAAKGTP